MRALTAKLISDVAMVVGRNLLTQQRSNPLTLACTVWPLPCVGIVTAVGCTLSLCTAGAAVKAIPGRVIQSKCQQRGGLPRLHAAALVSTLKSTLRWLLAKRPSQVATKTLKPCNKPLRAGAEHR